MIIHNPYISGSLTLENPISGTLEDAPSDGNTYVRKDGQWIILQSTGTQTIDVFTLTSKWEQTFIRNIQILNFNDTGIYLGA